MLGFLRRTHLYNNLPFTPPPKTKLASVAFYSLQPSFLDQHGWGLPRFGLTLQANSAARHPTVQERPRKSGLFHLEDAKLDSPLIAMYLYFLLFGSQLLCLHSH